MVPTFSFCLPITILDPWATLIHPPFLYFVTTRVTYMESNTMYVPFGTVSSPLSLILWKLIQIGVYTIQSSFVLLNHIPWYGGTTICLINHPLKQTWVVSG